MIKQSRYVEFLLVKHAADYGIKIVETASSQGPSTSSYALFESAHMVFTSLK